MGIGKASIFLGWSINGKIIVDGMFVNIGRSIMGKEMGTHKLSLIVGKDDEKKRKKPAATFYSVVQIRQMFSFILQWY